MNNFRPNGEAPSLSHGVVQGSNGQFGGESNVGATSGPRQRQMATFTPANNNFSGLESKTGSTQSAAKTASPVHTDDHKFKLGDAKMDQPQSTIAAGVGAVPVNPFAKGMNVAYMRDSNK